MSSRCSIRNFPIRSWWVGTEGTFDFGILSDNDETYIKESLLYGKPVIGFSPVSVTSDMLEDVGIINGVVIDMDIVDAVKAIARKYKEIEEELDEPGIGLTVIVGDISPDDFTKEEIDAAISTGEKSGIEVQPHEETRFR